MDIILRSRASGASEDDFRVVIMSDARTSTDGVSELCTNLFTWKFIITCNTSETGLGTVPKTTLRTRQTTSCNLQAAC